MMNAAESFIPYLPHAQDESDISNRSSEFYNFLKTRRSIREFSSRPVPREVIEDIIRSAGTAPSGANKQPWTFCIISNPELKSQIRKSAEEEEFTSYNGRMSEEWMKDLEPFGTNHIKEFIETCPYIIAVFKKAYDLDEHGNRHSNYYVNESVGIAVGFLLAAIHNAGLVSLTHSPSPMNFLQEILGRPENERPYLLIPVGYPKENVMVPNINRKPIEDIAVFYH